MQKCMLNVRSFVVFPVPGAGGISSVPRMLTCGKVGLDLSFAAIQVRIDKPITKLKTEVIRNDGTVVLDGEALCYTMPLK